MELRRATYAASDFQVRCMVWFCSMKQYKVLRPCIIWADQRSDAQCRWMTEQVGASRLIEYVSNPALPGFSAPKALWVRDNEPEIFAQTRTIILPKDYIRFRLTGVLAMEISDAAGTCLLDVKHGSWSQEVLHAIGFDSSLTATCCCRRCCLRRNHR